MKHSIVVILFMLFSGCEQLIFPSTEESTHPRFTPDYIAENKGTFSVEIPEVQELIHIIIAITPTGLLDRNMVDHSSEYYDEVIDHFKPFSDQPIVETINSMVHNGSYARVKMDACGYFFDENSIIKNTIYDRLNWGLINYLSPFIDELESFAQQSGFRRFFKNHAAYYQESTDLFKEQVPIRDQWNWLERHSQFSYDHYWITFSPLTGGSHSTNRFETASFKQTVMFISGPIKNSKFNEAVTNALMTRVLFTEIDHNYVNPVSDSYTREITSSLKNLSRWSNNNNYPSANDVFNEYMTWALFIAYASERLNHEDFKVVTDLVVNQMVVSRGFQKFSQFNDTLLSLYKEQTNKSIEGLYPAILDWCEQQ